MCVLYRENVTIIRNHSDHHIWHIKWYATSSLGSLHRWLFYSKVVWHVVGGPMHFKYHTSYIA